MRNEQLVTENLNIASRLARKYALTMPHKKDDFYQEAVIGIINAANSYDGSKGEFKPIAYMYAKRQVQAYLKQTVGFFRYSGLAYRKLFWKTNNLKMAYEQGEEAIQKFCEDEGITEEQFEKVYKFLSATPHGYPQSEEVGDKWLLFSATYNPAESDIDTATIKQEISAALAQLPPKHAEVLRMMYFNEEPKTAAAVARLWNVSRQRIEQIENTAIAKLKKILITSPTFKDLVA